MDAPSLPDPKVWPSDLYRAIEAGQRDDVLVICTAHRGIHVRYMGACIAKPPRRAMGNALELRRPDEPPDMMATQIAKGIVEGFRAARREQNDERRARR